MHSTFSLACSRFISGHASFTHTAHITHIFSSNYFLFSLILCLSCSFMASEPGRDTPSLKYIGLVRPWSKLHLKPQYVIDFAETSALNRTTALCMHLSNCICRPSWSFSFHTLLLTVHKLRGSELACNQCVMLLLALPINTQAENLFHPLRLMDRLS